MTTPPPTPPAPPAPPAPDPTPPTPPAPPAPPAPPDDAAELRSALDAARKRAKQLETDLAKLRTDGVTEAEKAIAAARAEGKAEAAADHARQLAAAEFRVQAAGKISNPDAALDAFNLDRLVKDGQPDKAAIAKLVEQLAVPAAAPGHVRPAPGPPRPMGHVTGSGTYSPAGRARGRRPECGRVLCGRAEGIERRHADRRLVLLPPHLVLPWPSTANRVCLARGARLRVPRV